MYNGGPGNVLYDGVFLMIRVYNGFRNKFSSVAQAATLGNFLICINARWPRIDIEVF